MISLASVRRLSVRVQLLLSAMFLGLSVQMLSLHTGDVKAMRDVGLPAALELPAVEHRISILKEQSDAAAMQASVAGDSSAEMLHMYVLPDTSGLDRLLATIDTFTTELKRTGMLKNLSAVQVGNAEPVSLSGAALTKVPVSFEADMTLEGVQALFLFQKLSGYLTIGDVLTSEQQHLLLQLTEQENPAAITALETFLSTDLLTYAAQPAEVQNNLLKSFTSDSFAVSLKELIAQSDLASASQLLNSPLGHALQTQKLWPLRFLIPVKSALRQTGDTTYHIAVTWEVYGRQK